jgi:hypothetical protein
MVDRAERKGLVLCNIKTHLQKVIKWIVREPLGLPLNTYVAILYSDIQTYILLY